ncbi:unnamed protein product [Pleuronectes platessa]|uniref:Uncharacterized protein n=1 Tax=Pleuronectes platessa TaxID=8262 RepID=A0A9N7ZC30_PLEPL|nr:unnamed protein product [Pleuronectes platessa]
MLCPAAVSAAAVWLLLAVLGPGLSLPAEENAEQGFTRCSDCFYRQTPPRGASAGPLLHPLCHTLPGRQAFATLSKPACDTAVYSAFHLRHGWTEEEEGEELLSEEENNIKAAAPILLRGGGDPSDFRLRLPSATLGLNGHNTGSVKHQSSVQHFRGRSLHPDRGGGSQGGRRWR